MNIKEYVTGNFNIGDSVSIALKNGTIVNNKDSMTTFVLRHPKPYMATYSQAKKLNSMNLELNIVDFKDESQKDFLILTCVSDKYNKKLSINEVPQEILIKVSYDTIDKINYQEKISPPTTRLMDV